MRIVLFTVENAEFMPIVLGPVLEERRSQIVAAFVSRTIYGFRFIRRRTRFLVHNRYPFCIRARDWQLFFYHRARSWLRRNGEPRSTVDHLRERGIEAQYIEEIRTAQTLDRLRALDADVFLFCPFDKIAGPEFLAIPRTGTFNLHLGKLPEHRGGLHAFWVLRFGDPEAGATVHRVIPELDAGEIVAECRFPVGTKCMRDLMFDTMRACGPLVVSALERIEAGNWRPVDTSGRKVGYHMLPTRADFRAFYRRGCCLT